LKALERCGRSSLTDILLSQEELGAKILNLREVNQ
jgi:hypothetical protein